MSNPLYDNLFGKYLDAETVFIETTDDKVITHGGFVVIAARLANVFKSLGLKNVKGSHINAKQINDKYDFVVSRAVTRLDPFIDWIKANFNKKGFNELPNGILYLKGGDLTEELNEIRKKYTSYPISSYFAEDFFETKKVIQVVI